MLIEAQPITLLSWLQQSLLYPYLPYIHSGVSKFGTQLHSWHSHHIFCYLHRSGLERWWSKVSSFEQSTRSIVIVSRLDFDRANVAAQAAVGDIVNVKTHGWQLQQRSVPVIELGCIHIRKDQSHTYQSLHRNQMDCTLVLPLSHEVHC